MTISWNMIFKAFYETISEYGKMLLWLGMEYFIATFLSLVVHELGHLLGGLVTGYRFVSFTVLGLTICKKRGRLHFMFRRNFLQGQCLMESTSRESNCTLLVTGGYLTNLLTAVIAAVISAIGLLSGVGLFKSTFTLFVAVSGFMMFLLNRRKNGEATVDGAAYNEVRQGGGRQYNALMTIYRMIIDGYTFAEIPKELYGEAESGPKQEMSRELMLYRNYARLQIMGHALSNLAEQQDFSSRMHYLIEGIATNEAFTEKERNELMKLSEETLREPDLVFDAFDRIIEGSRSLSESRKSLCRAVMMKLNGERDEENTALGVLRNRVVKDFYSGEWKSAYLTYLMDFTTGETYEESWQSV